MRKTIKTYIALIVILKTIGDKSNLFQFWKHLQGKINENSLKHVNPQQKLYIFRAQAYFNAEIV